MMILLPAAVCAFCVALLSAIITVTYFKGGTKGSISAVSRSTRFATAFFLVVCSGLPLDVRAFFMVAVTTRVCFCSTGHNPSDLCHIRNRRGRTFGVPDHAGDPPACAILAPQRGREGRGRIT